jgi:hypothetical protein
MPVTNADNPTAEKPSKTVKAAPVVAKTDPAASAPVVAATDPAVQFLVSKRAHTEAALADGLATAAELEAVDEELRRLGYSA